MQIFDISRELTKEIAPWPGDVPFEFKLNGKIAEGSSVNVGMIGMSVHSGTHADARFHFEDGEWTIEQAQIENYFGPAVIADLSANYRDGAMPHMRVTDLEPMSDDIARAGRLLLKTNVWLDSTVFPKAIPTIAPEAPAWLQARGVKLVGFDLPSVDEITSKNLPNHHALGGAGIGIVESLDLSRVSAGVYQFVALPLKIAGADGSPVRAILWRE
jgi:arylformamidase